MTTKFDVREMEIFEDFCIETNYTNNTLRKYRNALNNYCNFHQKTLEELIREAEEDEDEIPLLKNRKIKKRLTRFRNYLINEKEFSAWTVKTNVMTVKSFYANNEITVPQIKLKNLKDSPNEFIGFKDLPDMQTIRTAIEGTKKAKHKALFLFAVCTGSARNELCTFTFKQFLDGILHYAPTAETPEDIVKLLDGKCEEKTVVPVFKMKRSKNNTYYYTAITPECTQFMINYLKAEGLDLKDDDPFFKLSKYGVATAFTLINDKFNWGKRGTYSFFSSHRVRKFNASKIKDMDFGDYIQGRSTTTTRKAYYKIDIEDVRKKYMEHMAKFTVYAHYELSINTEAYELLENENQRLNDELNKYKEQINELEERNKSFKNDMENMQNQINDIAFSNNISQIQEYISDNELVNEFNLASDVVKLYRSDIEKDTSLIVDNSYIDTLITRAHNMSNRDRFDRKRKGAGGELAKNKEFIQIKQKIFSYKSAIIRSHDYMLSDSQEKLLDDKLEEYGIDLWWDKETNFDKKRVSDMVMKIATEGKL